MADDHLGLVMPDGTQLAFSRMASPIEDPIFRFFDDLGVHIDGMPLAVFSDALPEFQRSTLLTTTMDQFFHPDFDLVDERVKHKDFSEEEARLGRKYYPHKEKIVALLREINAAEPDRFPFQLARERININLMSNYAVSYIDQRGVPVFQKVYTVTNLDSCLKMKERYLDKLSRLNLGDDYLSARRLLLDTHILSSPLLCEFVYRTTEMVVKKSIEMRGVYRLLWKDEEMAVPQTEPRAQPLVKSLLQPILEIKGIQISREIVAANGSLDFHCSYTRDAGLYKVCMEMKNAHHKQLDHGLEVQLPAYMRDENTRDGIFLVLWYKCASFPWPARFESADELKAHLEQKVPNGLRVKPLVVDCTRPPRPSDASARA